MAILLYPPDLLNEKLLIKVRDCMINLKMDHPIKKWVLAVSQIGNKKVETTDHSFLIEIINSKFNLITDQKIKNKVITIIGELNDSSIQKKILKSYLYLMIGNITRSDNLLLRIVNTRPLRFLESNISDNDIVDKIVEANLEKILDKFSRHPADREIFGLLSEYLKNFTNKKDLQEILNDVIDEDFVEAKLDLRYLSQKAPDLVKFLKFKRLNGLTFQKELQDIKNNSTEFQMNWVWPFLGYPTFYNQEHQKAFFEHDKIEHLWTYYLIEDEKLSEIYATNSRRKTPSQQRLFLREKLNDKKTFMLALYKLIELGDVDETLVLATSNFILQ